MDKVTRPWPALWALCVGFFMILVDSTIVSVANPKIMEGLNTDINTVIWVTSAYLLAYAVPLLITGRLGDRFGPKNLYLIGLVVFTLSSAWCGMMGLPGGTVEMLIVARVFQGLGAALMTPQTMAVITRIFPPQNRGQAMGLWGAVAGVATLVGPILGGVLVDGFGWEWIFFINVPVGIVAFVMAWRLVPRLAKRSHKFDILGVALSAVGMFLLVFGIQEGQTYNWGTIAGPITVWSLIIGGIAFMVAFVVWQHYNRGEPLLPLKLFRDRNFSLANAAITTVGFTITSMSLPLVFFFQIVLGFSPTQSALMLVPMAVISGALAAPVGKLVDKINPRYLALAGLLFLAVALFWYSAWLDTDVNLWWRLLLPSALMGLANAFVWSPISTTATYNLPQADAGAGSGVYNATRQVGAVLGSASIATLIVARLGANGLKASATGGEIAGALPDQLKAGFTAAMAQSLLLPAAVALVGAVIVIFFAKPRKNEAWTHALTTQGVRTAAAAAAHGSHAAPVDVDAVPAAAASHTTHGSHAATVQVEAEVEVDAE
ncbi:DHA2 family efflux MFS transporter permease subunit [Rathayibacter soli]|uniref:DHA2 family efflux MFS transporter permease subunit n=1 Tax=Rathayibacter soli TaxID=3144168 RepID=UPI0027E579A0|nr:DHA2 family efflux MFS transporter permease subunit [Glaciibacter superstes]